MTQRSTFFSPLHLTRYIGPTVLCLCRGASQTIITSRCKFPQPAPSPWYSDRFAATVTLLRGEAGRPEDTVLYLERIIVQTSASAGSKVAVDGAFETVRAGYSR